MHETYSASLGELWEKTGFWDPRNTMRNFLRWGRGLFALALSRALSLLKIPHRVNLLVYYFGEVGGIEVNLKPRTVRHELSMNGKHADFRKHLADIAANHCNIDHVFVSCWGKDYDVRWAFDVRKWVSRRHKVEESGIVPVRGKKGLTELVRHTGFYTVENPGELAKLEDSVTEFLKGKISG